MTFDGSKSMATALCAFFAALFVCLFVFVLFFCGLFLCFVFHRRFCNNCMGLIGLPSRYDRSLMKTPSGASSSCLWTVYTGQSAIGKPVNGSHLSDFKYLHPPVGFSHAHSEVRGHLTFGASTP